MATYNISTLDELQAMSSHLADDCVLLNDIDASPTSGWNSGAGFVPVGDSTNNFTGSFDGQHYRITGLYINRPTTDYVGLFGYVHLVLTSSKLQNVALVDVDITGQGYVGALAGHHWRGNVENCCVTGIVTASARACGGLIGYKKYQDILDCFSKATVSGEQSTGGLLGYGYASVLSDIERCYATGPVTGTGDEVGGLIGKMATGSQVFNCYASGNVIGIDEVGGLIGNAYQADVEDCYATGDVNGVRDVGGLIGWNRWNYYYGVIENCYATGTVTASGTLDFMFGCGGLVGTSRYRGIINNCYSTGYVYSTGNGANIGILVGFQEDDTYDPENPVPPSIIYNCYCYDRLGDDASVCANHGTIDCTKADSISHFYDKNNEPYNDAGTPEWDFTAETGDWKETDTYPILMWQHIDIGLRYYDGSAVQKIATKELVSTHKLRIEKGATTYGIPLVYPSDCRACKRIYDGSAVKALAKYA